MNIEQFERSVVKLWELGSTLEKSGQCDARANLLCGCAIAVAGTDFWEDANFLMDIAHTIRRIDNKENRDAA